jgi:hypothetical protein
LRASRHETHVLAGAREQSTVERANTAGADDNDLHRRRRGGGAAYSCYCYQRRQSQL